MDVRELLEQVKSDGVNIEETERQLKNLSYEDLGYAKLDHHRRLRSGFGGTVFYREKPNAYLLEMYKKFYGRDGEVLGTRVPERQAELVRTAIPEAVYDPISRIPKVEKPGRERKGYVVVRTGDTAGIPMIEEAAQTAEYFGCRVDHIFDVGAAGIYRLLVQRKRLDKASCIVTMVGMEGAPGTMITGLVERPIVAVPASVGYGANFYGLSTLLTMLNSYANEISVVNIDNGHDTGYLTTQINRMTVR